jgi:diadenylate cyclase
MLQNITNKLIEMIYSVSTLLNLDSPGRVIILILDIVIVLLIAIYVYRLIKQTRAEQIVKGIVILIFLLIVSNVFNMVILKFLLTNLMTYGMLLFIVVFQPELRNAFEKIGRSKIVDVFDMDDNIMVKHSISEIVKAVEIMSMKKIGVLNST